MAYSVYDPFGQGGQQGYTVDDLLGPETPQGTTLPSVDDLLGPETPQGTTLPSVDDLLGPESQPVEKPGVLQRVVAGAIKGVANAPPVAAARRYLGPVIGKELDVAAGLAAPSAGRQISVPEAALRTAAVQLVPGEARRAPIEEKILGAVPAAKLTERSPLRLGLTGAEVLGGAAAAGAVGREAAYLKGIGTVLEPATAAVRSIGRLAAPETAKALAEAAKAQPAVGKAAQFLQKRVGIQPATLPARVAAAAVSAPMGAAEAAAFGLIQQGIEKGTIDQATIDEAIRYAPFGAAISGLMGAASGRVASAAETLTRHPLENLKVESDPFVVLGLEPRTATAADVAEALKAKKAVWDPKINSLPEARETAAAYEAAADQARGSIAGRDLRARRKPQEPPGTVEPQPPVQGLERPAAVTDVTRPPTVDELLQVERGPERRVVDVPTQSERRISDRRLAVAAGEAQGEVGLMESAIAESKKLAAESEAARARVSGETQSATLKPEDIGLTAIPERGGVPTTELPRADEFVNVPKFAPVTEDAERLLREQTLVVAKEQGLDPKQREPWQVIRKEAEKVALAWGLNPRKFDLAAAQGLGRAEMLAARDIVGTNVDRMASLYQELGTTNDLVRRAAIENDLSHLEGVNSHILGKFIRDRSEYGRNLASLKMVATKITDADYWQMRMMKMLDVPNLQIELKRELTELVANVRNAPSEAAKQAAAETLAKRLVSARKSTWREKAVTLWKAGLLTNVSTHLVNGMSNTAFQGLEAGVTRPAAAVADYFLGLASGMRTTSGLTTRSARASMEGAKAGWREAGRIMGEAVRGRTALSAEQLLKLDQIKSTNFDWPILNVYTKSVFGLLSASDQVFYRAALEGALTNAAEAWAKETRQPVAAVVRDLLETYRSGKPVGLAKGAPLDELADLAKNSAEELVFRNETRLGKAAQGVVKAMGTAAELVVPFTRTPASIAGQVFNYSPLGLAKTGFDLAGFLKKAHLDEAISRKEQQALAVALGRGTVGTLGLVGLGAYLHEKDLATGSYPPRQDQRERSLWQLEGRQPNSIRVGDQWVNIGRLSPVGNVIILGAILADAAKHGMDATALGGMVFGVVKTVADQPFLTGISGALEAVNDQTRSAGRFVERLASSAVPTLVAASARAADESARVAHGVGPAFKARLPGQTRDLPAMRDELGRPVTRGKSALYRVINEVVNPFKARADITANDPVVTELARVGTAPGQLGRRPDESESDYQDRKGVYGQAVRRALADLFATSAYRATDREEQQRLIERTVSQARSALTRPAASGGFSLPRLPALPRR